MKAQALRKARGWIELELNVAPASRRLGCAEQRSRPAKLNGKFRELFSSRRSTFGGDQFAMSIKQKAVADRLRLDTRMLAGRK
jgi:hypothetical protein